MIHRFPVVCFLILLALTGFAHGQGQSLLYTVPFKSGDEGAKIYRIPAIWWLPKKPLLAFAERRMEQRRMFGDVDIVMRRSLDQGQTWEPQQVIANLERDTCGNPCVVRDALNGRLWLAFTRSRNADIEEDIVAGKVPGTGVWITHSDDDGVTWAAPRDISATARKPDWGWYGTGPGQGLFLRGGSSKPDRILIPAYHTEAGVYRTHAIFSDDHGDTWQLGADAADHTSEPQVIEMDSRTLLMNARTISGHGVHRTQVVSRDRGQTWLPAEGMAELIENNCQGCLYKCFRNGSNGQYDWIFSHPISSGRTGVHAWISDDEGKSWPYAQMLWSGPSAYTSMVRVQGGLVGMLIECGTKDVYEQIAFVKFAPEWLRGRKAPASDGPPDSAASVFPEGKRIQVFVITGQSNSLGTTGDPDEEDITPGLDPLDRQIPFFWSNRSTRAGDGPAMLYGNSGGKIVTLRAQQGEGPDPIFWGPEFGFGRTLAATGKKDFMIVKASRGGGGNSYWLKGNGDDHMYRHVVQTVREAVQQLPAGTEFDIAGLLYLQGESDHAAEAAVAGERLLTLAANLREDLPNATAMRVLVSGIVPSGKNQDMVRARQSALPALDPSFRYLDNMEWKPRRYDGAHYVKSAKLELGQRLGKMWLEWGK